MPNEDVVFGGSRDPNLRRHPGDYIEHLHSTTMHPQNLENSEFQNMILVPHSLGETAPSLCGENLPAA